MKRLERVDILLVEKGLAESRSQAQRLIMAGQVRADTELIHKPSQKVSPGSELDVIALPQYVSRGGEKLHAALLEFHIDVKGRICGDIGASTGGFTDCLLQHGAKRVYAVDVGQGQLHWKMRNDDRVVSMEGINAREYQAFPEELDLVTIDVSFISLRYILPNAACWLKNDGELVALIKPQFEAGRTQVGKGGVVKDRAVHGEVVGRVLGDAKSVGLIPQDVVVSPLTGPKGNIEFFMYCKLGGSSIELREFLQKLDLG